MKKKLIAILALAVMVMGTSVTAAAAETKTAEESAAEEVTEAAEETEERDYNPEEGKGWLTAEINEEPVEFEYAGQTKGIC